MLVPIAQYFNTNGQVLAFGCVFTFAAGTNTNQATYSDSLGTTQLPNPILLNGSGYPTNASGGVTTVFVTSQAYKFVLKTAGGVNCATGSQIYSADNVQGFLGVLNLANTWAQQQTFSLPIVVTPTSLQFVVGALGQQTTLNFPQPLGNVTLNFPNTADTMVGRATTDTLTNKTLTNATLNSPSISTPTINGTLVSGSPATYVSFSNDITTGTTLNTLTKMLGGTAVISGAGDTGGAIGITVSGAGKSGIATIQQNGAASCVFDNATTAGDYIQISTTTAGDCHDIGAVYPANGQVIGRASVTVGSPATDGIVLFGPEVKPPGSPIAVNLTAQSANITATTITTPSANGFYRATCYMVVTTAAGTSSTLPQCSVNWTDADTSVAENVVLSNVNSNNTVGSVGTQPVFTNGFYAKSGSVITYQTSSYASNPASAMQYALHLRLEGPF